LDSAEFFLKSFVDGSHKQIVLSKAYLLLGNAQYSQQKYQEAIDSYQMVKGSPDKHSLLTSGALHGLAASYMQLKEYPKAIELLEEFVDTYMKRTGSLEDRSSNREPQDLSPAVPNVLWKLALCYKFIDQPEKAKLMCQKLVNTYKDTDEAAKAERLLLTI
jgi:TolA-binding protein